MKRSWIALTFICIFSFQVLRAEDPELWNRAQDAYRSGNNEAGHLLLKKLLDSNPGDKQIASRCLQKILAVAGRTNNKSPWVQFATRRLCALKRIGALGASSRIGREAFEAQVDIDITEGRLLKVREEMDRLVGENPNDVHYKIIRAQAHRRLDTPQTRDLYSELQEEMDLDHPDPVTRDLWFRLRSELEVDLNKLPAPLINIGKMSPLLYLEPDDPEGNWRTALDRSPMDVPEHFDRLAGHALIEDQIILWKDFSGLVDPAQVLDLHLKLKPSRELEPLRKVQEEQFSIEVVPEAPTEEQVLMYNRRYPWAVSAQKLLLKLASDSLWQGRTQSALRSFDQILEHTHNPELLNSALLGRLAALAQFETQEELQAEFGKLDPQKKFSWLSQPVTTSELLEKLLPTAKVIEKEEISQLDQAQFKVVRIPPVSPWPTNTAGASYSVDLQVIEEALLISSRNLLVCFDKDKTDQARWTQVQRNLAQDGNPKSFLPGTYKPSSDGIDIFTRWGLTSAPQMLAAFNLQSGQPRWSSQEAQRSRLQNQWRFQIPLADPVLSDGLLYFLRLSSRGNIQNGRDRRLSLVCLDPSTSTELWDTEIAQAGRSSDFVSNLERTQVQYALYGNRVTVHRGAIYANSNCGIISKSDARDGRVDWIHYYRRNHAVGGVGFGSSPIIFKDKVICVPRDAGRIFALDQSSGRLLWDNPFSPAHDVLGQTEGILIVLGRQELLGVDLDSGKTLWQKILKRRHIGRAQMIGDSIYVGNDLELLRVDGSNGQVLESKTWDLKGERPMAFQVHEGSIFVVTDQPAEDSRQPLNEAIHIVHDPDPKPFTPPFQRTWTLSRPGARLTLPDSSSPLKGKGYLLSEGVLECIDVSAQGAVKWRRFVEARDPGLHLVDDKLLIVDHAGGLGRSLGNVVALDGQTGHIQWDTPIQLQVQQTMQSGDQQIFHDGKSKVIALDLKTGSHLWSLPVGADQLRVKADGDKLHLLNVSFQRSSSHLILDSKTGSVVDEHEMKVYDEPGATLVDGKKLTNGYYEVQFAPKEARYVRLVGLSEINGRGWMSIAELHVRGEDGERISRDTWSVIKTSSTETQARYDTRPETVFDGDPDLWWHTQWIGGIPEHPHEIQLDLGKSQKIQALQYLPAVIINNNGMIRDYELYVSNDLQNWGPPVAKGVMVNRIQIRQPVFGDSAVVFEARNYKKKVDELYRYDLDGKVAFPVAENARLMQVQGDYLLTRVNPGQGHEILTVFRLDDEAYRFEVGPVGSYNHPQIDGDILVFSHPQFAVVDLKQRKFLVNPSEDRNHPRNRSGTIVKVSEKKLMKLVHQGREGQLALMVDLETGGFQESMFKEQIEPFKDPRRNPNRLFATSDVFLYYDGSLLSAWTGTRQ